MAILDWLPRMLVVLAFGCMAAMGSSQLAVPDAARPVEGRVEGQVVDAVTGQPIPRALVRSGNREALTDHEGRFSFDKAYKDSATAEKPGYVGESVSGREPVLLRLVPQAILSGTVTDADAQPLQHLQIQLRALQFRAGLAHWQQTESTITNAEGEFRFADLQAGKYSLATGLLVDGLPEAVSSLAFVPSVYPSPGSGEAEDAVTLRDGARVQANISLAAEKLYTVSGVLHGSLGRGVTFSVATLEGLTVNTEPHFFQASGVFRFRLPRGSYRLQAQVQTDDQQLLTGTREITVSPAALEGVSIVITPLPAIPVEVEMQHSGSSQQRETAPSYLNLSLNSEDSANGYATIAAQPADVSPHAPVAGDPLVFRSVPPARYVLQAQIVPPWYIASASCGSLDLTRDPLVVGVGNGACSLRVVLREDAATLQWTVANPKGTVTVMAFPLSNLTLPVGGLGSYLGSDNERITGTIEGLAPGRYLVIAARHNLDVPYRDPEALKKYLSWGKEVTLAANGQAEVELALAPDADAGEPQGEP